MCQEILDSESAFIKKRNRLLEKFGTITPEAKQPCKVCGKWYNLHKKGRCPKPNPSPEDKTTQP